MKFLVPRQPPVIYSPQPHGQALKQRSNIHVRTEGWRRTALGWILLMISEIDLALS